MARPTKTTKPPTRSGADAQDIRLPRQIALLAAPARQELIDTLEALGGEASVAALAAHLGKPADGLYYHLRLLVKGGLLEQLPDEGEGRRYRTHATPGKRLRVHYTPGANAKADAVGRVASGMLRIAGRDFAAGLADPTTIGDGALRELWASRSKGWVGETELREVNALLARLLELLHRPRSADRDRLVALTWVLSPVAAKPTRRKA